MEAIEGHYVHSLIPMIHRLASRLFTILHSRLVRMWGRMEPQEEMGIKGFK